MASSSIGLKIGWPVGGAALPPRRDTRAIGEFFLEEFLQAEALLSGAGSLNRPEAEQRYRETWRRISQYILSGTVPD